VFNLDVCLPIESVIFHLRRLAWGCSTCNKGLCQQCLNLLRGGCHLVDFDFLIDGGLLQVEAGNTLELPDWKAWGFFYLITLCFPNTSARCPVKYLWGHELSFDPIFIISFARVLADTNLCFCCSSQPSFEGR
jgi:hypothetical protein